MLLHPGIKVALVAATGKQWFDSTAGGEALAKKKTPTN